MGKLLDCFTWLVWNNSHPGKTLRVRMGEGAGTISGVPSAVRASELRSSAVLPTRAAGSRCSSLHRNKAPLCRREPAQRAPPRFSSNGSTFQKVFQLRLLLASWAFPLCAVLSNTSFSPSWRQWSFQALHCVLCGGLVFSFVWLQHESALQVGFWYSQTVPPLFSLSFLFCGLFKRTNQRTKAVKSMLAGRIVRHLLC